MAKCRPGKPELKGWQKPIDPPTSGRDARRGVDQTAAFYSEMIYKQHLPPVVITVTADGLCSNHYQEAGRR